jgi:hypothetical protein
VRDWTSVVAVASRTWLAPTLFVSLTQSGQIEAAPNDVREYLALLNARNRERNLRLRDQLFEAGLALNEIGIEPTLVKGAVDLIQAPDSQIGRRMTSDLDLAIEEPRYKEARRRLMAIGYEEIAGTRDLARAQDVGVLELRSHSNAPSTYHDPLRQEFGPTRRECGGMWAWIPSPTASALHWILHDLLKEGDYWRGRIDLRHLYDLAKLAESERGVDFAHLREIVRGRSARNAFDTQLITLNCIFAVPIPPGVAGLSMARVQHERRLFSVNHPIAGAPLRLAGNLAWGMKRLLAVDRRGHAGRADFGTRVIRTLRGAHTGAKL